MSILINPCIYTNLQKLCQQHMAEKTYLLRLKRSIRKIGWNNPFIYFSEYLADSQTLLYIYELILNGQLHYIDVTVVFICKKPKNGLKGKQIRTDVRANYLHACLVGFEKFWARIFCFSLKKAFRKPLIETFIVCMFQFLAIFTHAVHYYRTHCWYTPDVTSQFLLSEVPNNS